MEFISENIIDQIIDNLESKEKFEQLSKSLIIGQPSILAYLESESFNILTELEKDLLWYGVLVISESIHQSIDTIKRVKINDLEKWEEENYDLAGEKLKFQEMADLFFEDYEQEDLLAFVEDYLLPDSDEMIISPVGRKVIFLTLKTIIDAYQTSI